MLGSRGNVTKFTSAIFFRTEDFSKNTTTKRHNNVMDGVSERLNLLFFAHIHALSESAFFICRRFQGSFVHWNNDLKKYNPYRSNR